MTASFSLREIGGSIVLGALSAALFYFVEIPEDAVLQFLASLTCLPLFVVALGRGTGSGALAVATGFVLLLALKSLYVAGIYVIVYGLPVVALSALAFRQAKVTGGKAMESTLLTAMTIYPCALFLGLATAMISQPGGLAAFTDRQMTNEFNAAVADYQSALDPAMLANITNALHRINFWLPATMGVLWIFMILFGVYVARWALRKKAWSQSPAFNFTKFSVPTGIIIAAALAGMAGDFAPAPYDYFGMNLFAILLTQLVIGGVAFLCRRLSPANMKLCVLGLVCCMAALPPGGGA